jgi:hypothetical protein
MAKQDHDDLRDRSDDLREQGRCALDELKARADALDAPANVKANNPKDAFGTLKASLSWVPMEVIFELALAFAEGGFKYGAHNYLVAEPRASVYLDAAGRHVFDFWTLGVDIDAESKVGLHHISKAIALLAVLRAAQIHGKWIDDRPPPAPADFLQSLNEKMKLLAATFPDPVARYLSNGKRGPGRLEAKYTGPLNSGTARSRLNVAKYTRPESDRAKITKRIQSLRRMICVKALVRTLLP